MSLFSLLGAIFERWHAHALQQQVVVVCMKKEGRLGAGISPKEFGLLLERLQRVAQAHPASLYDGKEIHGDEVRLYFFSDSARTLAHALAVALTELSWCRGTAVRVCSDLGARLEEYVVPWVNSPLPVMPRQSTTRRVDLQ